MSDYREEMTDTARSQAEMPEYLHEARDAILDIALPNVPFDGWSEKLFRDAVAESGVDPATAKLAFPRGAVDLASEAHRRDDRRFSDQMAEIEDVLRVREKITKAIRMRLELAAESEEAVRRASAMFALPQNAAEGARLTWGTADVI